MLLGSVAHIPFLCQGRYIKTESRCGLERYRCQLWSPFSKVRPYLERRKLPIVFYDFFQCPGRCEEAAYCSHEPLVLACKIRKMSLLNSWSRHSAVKSHLRTLGRQVWGVTFFLIFASFFPPLWIFKLLVRK